MDLGVRRGLDLTWLLGIIIILVKLYNLSKLLLPLQKINKLSYISTMRMVSEAIKKLFSFSFPTLPPIKNSLPMKNLLWQTSPLARLEPGYQHRIALK